MLTNDSFCQTVRLGSASSPDTFRPRSKHWIVLSLLRVVLGAASDVYDDRNRGDS